MMVVDLFLNGLQYHNCIVDNYTDGKNKGKKGKQVDGKMEESKCRKGAYKRDRNGNGWNKCCPPVLEENENDNKHQDKSLHKGFEDFLYGCAYKGRGIKSHLVGDPFRKFFGQGNQGDIASLLHGQGV